MSINKNFNNNSLPSKTSVFNSIDVNKIGEGKYFTEGKFGHRKNLGIKGQLSRIKRIGRSVTKNLSKKNLQDMSDIIANRLKKHTRGYGVHVSRRDKISMMQEAEKLVRAKGSNFSREDKKDLESIVDSLKEQSKKTILNKRYGTEKSRVEENPLLRNKMRTEKSKKIVSNDQIKSSLASLEDNRSSKNENEVIYESSSKDVEETVADSEKNLNMPFSEQDDEIEEIRKQAKDLAI
jgi:hypothetical protein